MRCSKARRCQSKQELPLWQPSGQLLTPVRKPGALLKRSTPVVAFPVLPKPPYNLSFL